MLSLRDHLTKEDAITVASIERGVPILVPARDLVERFHRMVRDRDPDVLPAWITHAAGSVLASFGKGIATDRAVVAAALTQPWSNGQTEGQITKLKLCADKCMAAASSIFSVPASPRHRDAQNCTEIESEPPLLAV